MNITYKSQITINADIDAAWALVTQQNFVKDYFPEIKKNTVQMGQYIQSTHKNPYEIFPDYMIPNRSMGWTTGAGIKISLPRKDVEANIQAIDITFQRHGKDTQISIEVTFEPIFNKNIVFAAYCIRNMVKAKLRAFKQDIDVTHHEGWSPVPVFV